MATVKLTDKPVVQELMDGDQVVLIQNGAVRRIDAEKVGGKAPVIDLYSAGVNVNVDRFEESIPFEVSTDIVTQLVTAAQNGGALLKFGFVTDQMRLPMQAYLVAGAVEPMEVYQFSGKFVLNSTGVNVFFVLQLQDNVPMFSCCTIDQPLLPIPEPSDDGAFLRAENGEWVISKVPSAEEGAF